MRYLYLLCAFLSTSSSVAFIPSSSSLYLSCERDAVLQLYSQQPLSNNNDVAYANGDKDSEEGNTVLKLQNPSNGMLCTLVGTAHLSKASNEQVREIITSVRPDVVMVELDKDRLERIGFENSGEDLGIPFTTSADIFPPLEDDDKFAMANKPWYSPVQDFALDAFTKFARKFLKDMYSDMAEEMNKDGDGEMVGGGEFKVAIDTAKEIPECERVILGDRDSMMTIRRAAELALRSGNAFDVLDKLQKVNSDQFEVAEKDILEEYGEEKVSEMTTGEYTTKVIEKLKSDKSSRTKLFARLEKEVPAFSRAFMKERDFIMAECINRESEKGTATPKHVVAVVGLAHLPGMARNLKQTWNIDEDK